MPDLNSVEMQMWNKDIYYICRYMGGLCVHTIICWLHCFPGRIVTFWHIVADTTGAETTNKRVVKHVLTHNVMHTIQHNKQGNTQYNAYNTKNWGVVMSKILLNTTQQTGGLIHNTTNRTTRNIIQHSIAMSNFLTNNHQYFTRSICMIIDFTFSMHDCAYNQADTSCSCTGSSRSVLIKNYFQMT